LELAGAYNKTKIGSSNILNVTLVPHLIKACLIVLELEHGDDFTYALMSCALASVHSSEEECNGCFSYKPSKNKHHLVNAGRTGELEAVYHVTVGPVISE
jgi:hypothetical protein